MATKKQGKKTLHCRLCDKPIAPGKSGSPRLYCSARCKQAAYRGRKIASSGASIAEQSAEWEKLLSRMGISQVDVWKAAERVIDSWE